MRAGVWIGGAIRIGLLMTEDQAKKIFERARCMALEAGVKQRRQNQTPTDALNLLQALKKVTESGHDQPDQL